MLHEVLFVVADSIVISYLQTNKNAFEITVTKRSYKFSDSNHGADYWVKHINDALRLL